MADASRLGGLDWEQLLFGVAGVLVGVLAVAVLASGSDPVRGLLFAAFALYLFGVAAPPVHERVADYRRMGAIALGAVGLLAMLAGTSSALPLLFVLGGAAALFGII